MATSVWVLGEARGPLRGPARAHPCCHPCLSSMEAGTLRQVADRAAGVEKAELTGEEENMPHGTGCWPAVSGQRGPFWRQQRHCEDSRGVGQCFRGKLKTERQGDSQKGSGKV